MIYCDASLLVALLVNESHSEAVDGWFAEQSAGSLVASHWAETEVGSALALKYRTGLLTAAQRVSAADAAAGLFDGLELVPVERRHFATAATKFVMVPPSGLRAGDALHLAIAADHGFALATLDRQLKIAAEQAGLETPSILAS